MDSLASRDFVYENIRRDAVGESRPDSLGPNPFVSNINEPLWKLRDGRTLSLRAIAAETLRPFRQRIRQISDPSTLEHITAVFAGDARSLLDFEKRPDAYDDVGHGIDWGRRRMRRWPRSKYEKIIHRVIAREPMRIGQKRYRVDRMNGWYEIEFREMGTKRRRTFNLDELVRMPTGKSQLRRHRANAKTAKSVAINPRNDGFQPSVLTRRLGSCRSLKHQFAHVFHGRAAIRDDLVIVFLRLNWSPTFFCSAARKSRCSVAPTK